MRLCTGIHRAQKRLKPLLLRPKVYTMLVLCFVGISLGAASSLKILITSNPQSSLKADLAERAQDGATVAEMQASSGLSEQYLFRGGWSCRGAGAICYLLEFQVIIRFTAIQVAWVVLLTQIHSSTEIMNLGLAHMVGTCFLTPFAHIWRYFVVQNYTNQRQKQRFHCKSTHTTDIRFCSELFSLQAPSSTTKEWWIGVCWNQFYCLKTGLMKTFICWKKTDRADPTWWLDVFEVEGDFDMICTSARLQPGAEEKDLQRLPGGQGGLEQSNNKKIFRQFWVRPNNWCLSVFKPINPSTLRLT